MKSKSKICCHQNQRFMMNKRGFGNVNIWMKFLAAAVAVIGFVFLFFDGFIFGFDLMFIDNVIITYILGVIGVIIFLNSMKGMVFGKRWLSFVLGLLFGGFGVYLVAVQLGYIVPYFVVSDFVMQVCLLVYGVYLFIYSYI